MSASPAVRGAELTLGGAHSVAQDKCVMTLCPRPQRHTGWVCGPERPLCPLRSASPAPRALTTTERTPGPTALRPSGCG